MEAEESSKPFWSRSYSASSSSSNPNSTSSNFKPYILAFISTSIIAILFFPSLLSTSSFRSFRPSLLKNGWDLLNFLLVVFAVLCGVLGRNHSDDTSAASSSSSSAAADPSHQHPNPVASSSNVDGMEWNPPTRRMRNSSSYPDLRQEQWWTEQDNNHSWQRYYDDSYIYNNNSFNRRSGPLRYDRHQQSIGSNYNTEEIKTVQAELIKESTMEEERSRSPPPPPPPPPPPLRQQHEHQPRRRRTRKTFPDPPPPPSPPPPRQQPVIPDPPPLPPPTPPRPKIQRKKSSGAKDIAVAFAQFYQKKRKRSSSKTKKKTQDKDDIINDNVTRVSSGPPTPPPPPPKMTFHSLFSNKSKKKSIPDPPPLPKSKTNYPLPYSPLRPMPRRQREGLPPKVPERFSFEYYNSDSNLSEILPPPPPPPPDSAPESPAFGHESQQVFCPSPDLNVKAEMFIKWFHDGLRLEKIHSIKEKEKQEKERQQRSVQGGEETVELS